MAITAMKTGARLPLTPSKQGKPPPLSKKEIVRFVPLELQKYERVFFVHTPLYTIMECSEESEPEAFAASASLSSSQAWF